MRLRNLAFVGVITVLFSVAPPPLEGFNASLRIDGKGSTLFDFSTIRTVVIDAGHGGKDPGCSGEHSREATIVLGIAQKLAVKMKAAFPQLEVILTRDEDVFIPLHERAAIANRARADLFISIHANYMPGSQATRGTETYVMGLHTAEHNLNVAKRENEAILLEEDYEANYDYDPNSDEGHILMAMVQSAYLDQSILFAEQVESQLAAAGRRSRGVKQAGFVVLKESAMPSVLVETGFLSSNREEAYLLSNAGQEQIAEALLEAFRAYRQIMDGTEAGIAGLENRPTPPAPLQSIQRAASAPPPAAPQSATQTPQIASETVAAAEPDLRPTPASQPPAPIIVPAQANADDRNLQSRELIQSDARPQRILPNYQAGSGPQTYARSVVHEPESVQLQNSTSAPPVVQQYQFEEAARARAIGTEVQYDFAVQLLASSTPLLPSDPQWDTVEVPIREVQENGWYKYQIRQIPSAADALSLRAELKSNGFPGAFIVVYHQGEKLNEASTRQLLQQ